MVHPVDPSNTATSVAAAAPAFNIRRLVLFAFIGRAFHLRVYSPVSPPPDVTVIALHADQLCSVLEEGVLMKNGRGSDYAQLSCARLRAGRDGRVLTPSTACPAEWPIPSPRPADSIPPAGIHDARQRQCDLCHASGSSCATPRHHRGTDSPRPTTAPLPGRPRTRTGTPTCTTPSSLNRVCTEPDWLSPRLNS
jgi:hypothetical protein